MIRIFESNFGGHKKVNFVDDQNRFVGYDTDDDCCAYGGWFISKKVEDSSDFYIPNYPEQKPKVTPNLSQYSFDDMFFRSIDFPKQDGSVVVFRLVCQSSPDLFLHLFNMHNGYYAKGFKASFGQTKEGYV